MREERTIVEAKTHNGLTVELAWEPGLVGETEWFVVLRDSSSFEEVLVQDEFQARHQFRSFCKAIGLDMPYVAPQFESPIPPAADPVEDAASIYYHYHARLTQLYPGSPEALEMRTEMVNDPRFVALADDILKLTPEKTNHWVIASIRVACRRVAAKEKQAALQAMEAVPNFGAF